MRTRRKLRFSDSESTVKTAWDRPKEEVESPVLNKKYENHSMSFFTKLLIASCIFCIIALGIGSYIFFNGGNLISANNIDISINGPVSVPSGEPVSFDINVTNKNNVDLELADLTVNFPDGTVQPGDPSQELHTYQHLIGDLAAGASSKQTVTAIVYGEENLQKELNVTVTYKVKGSTSLFTKDFAYDLLVNSSPINLTITSFKEITSGQEFDVKADIKSNSKDVLKNVLLKATYPFGFTYMSASPAPLSDAGLWNIGDIPPGGERIVTIHGKLTGEDSDVRAFHFALGTQSSKDSRAIGTQFMTTEQDITLQKPFVSLTVNVDSDDGTGDHIGQFTQPEHVEVNWYNNLAVPVSNAEIHVKLSGNAYDKTKVQPGNAYFNSGNDEIVWNQQTNPELASLGAGDSGKVSFSITPTDKSTPGSPVANPNIVVSSSVSGNRTEESNVPTALTATAARNIKISSSLALSGRIVRSTGPFANTGPIPPKAEQATTYTVVWTVDNGANPIGSGVVSAVLPTYVKWLGNISPSTEDVAYDPHTGTVTWTIGAMTAYTANASRRREVDFQIALTPSVSQVGQSPTLVNQAKFTAVDNYTSANLTATQDILTTRFSTDPTYSEGNERVTN